jgi:tetratricopeptide (TPR) repeat protein
MLELVKLFVNISHMHENLRRLIKIDDEYNAIPCASLEELYFYKHNKQHRDALVLLEYVIQMKPKDTYTLFEIATQYYELKEYNAALKWINLAIEYSSEEDFFLMYDKGVYLSLLDRDEEAVEVFKHAIEITGNINLEDTGHNPYMELAYSLYALKRFEEALDAVTICINTLPNESNGYRCLGDILDSTGKEEEALAAYTKACECDPMNAVAFSNRGYVLNSLERYEEAIEQLDTAISIESTIPEPYCHKGWATHKLGRNEEALLLLEKAIELDPDYTKAKERKSIVESVYFPN